MVVLTGLFLTGRITSASQSATAVFGNCGQGLREGGDVKTRGVLIGRINGIARLDDGDCSVSLALFPDKVDTVPRNVGAQVRAKTIFGEKWVELLYPDDPDPQSIEPGQEIAETIDPLEIETILNTALPILDAIDPEHLAGLLDALASGFVGHEDAAIRGIESGTEAVRVANENRALFSKGLRQLNESGEVFDKVDTDLLAALDKLDELGRFTKENSELLAQNLDKAPALLRELSTLFETRFVDLTKIVDRGATVIGLVASQTGDLQRLLDELPKFNANWVRNVTPTCRTRSAASGPGGEGPAGTAIPGRCWRVHNIISDTQGPYAPGEGPRPNQATQADQDAMILGDDNGGLSSLLLAPLRGAAR
ncbi:MAG: phospholipid/cholesterol/gamma-HCH transport system substrate-binding protein [Actinomycetota bacterium]|jgi:virulence factor Mce-like protein|nr:phospholipid/cholesterol/gamma-HCH transport system substrate-binding protein [Actinomycetota bacterium]